MDLIEVAKACARRWYVVLPVIAVSLWVSYSKYSSVKPVFYSNGVVGIAPPNQIVQNWGEGKPTPKNGLLEVGGAGLITNMAVLSLNNSTVRERVASQGGRPNYTVRMFPSPLTGAGSQMQLPLIMIEATEPDAASATKTVELVIAEADSAMTSLQRQSGVGDTELVRALVVSPPSSQQGIPSRTKSAALSFLAGGGAAILLAVVLDVFLTRRNPKPSFSPADSSGIQPRIRSDSASHSTAVIGSPSEIGQ